MSVLAVGCICEADLPRNQPQKLDFLISFVGFFLAKLILTKGHRRGV